MATGKPIVPIEHYVDPNGSLCLHVPIKVPPAKLSPEISVSYHSPITEMSVLGAGWELQAFGLIQRTGATIAQDGYAGTVNYDCHDKYTLNGQRLILISGNEYRYEVDQWSKVVAVGSDAANPNHWIEYLPNGNVKLYGSTSDSNLKAVGQPATRIWALAETRDPFNNYTSYSYTDDSGFLLLQSISYGGNSDLSMKHQRKAAFSYESRIDVRTEFVGGSAVVLKKRLTSISSSFNGALVHTHTFDYGYAPLTGISRLENITLSDASDVPVLPLAFSWSDSAPLVFDQAVTLNSFPAFTKDMQVLPVPVSGSGRTDLIIASKLYVYDQGSYFLNLDVYLSDGEGNISQTPQPGSGSTGLVYPDQLLAFDVNGDGKTDLLHISKAEKKHTLTVLLSTDKGYVPQKPFTFSPPALNGTYYSGDFEGNGYVGLVYVYDQYVYDRDEEKSIICLKQFISNGSSFLEGEQVEGPVGVKLDNVQVVIADFDGNGASDIFLTSPMFLEKSGWVWRIDFFQSRKGYLEFRSDDPFGGIGAQIEVAKIPAFLALPEQDGKTGLLLLSQNNNKNLQYQTLRSTGKSLALSNLKDTDLPYHGNINVGHSLSLTSLDLVNVVNLVEEKITKVNVLHFFDGEFQVVDTKKGVRQPPYLDNFDVNFVDLRGVGRTDCLFSHYNPLTNKLDLTCLPCAKTDSPADYIVGYKGGLDATLSVVYASLTDSTVYTISTCSSGSANPYVNALSRVSSSRAAINPSTLKVTSNVMGRTRSQLIRFPKYVIKQLTTCALPFAQPKIVSKAEYCYENARVSFDGRGWLGFETIVQKSDVLGTATTNTYKQEFPFIGQKSKMEIQDISDPDKPVELKRTTYTWERHLTGHGTQCYTTMPSIQQTLYEKGNPSYSVDVDHDYDSYANITSTRISTPGKPDLIISQKYSNDTDKWIIGSKLSESVTSNGSLMNQTNFTYLAGTQVVDQITKWVSNSSSTVEKLSFDAAGNVTKSEGPWRAQYTFVYDSTYCFPVTMTTAVDENSSLTISATYDYGLGKIASRTAYNGYITAHQYDVLGRVLQILEGESSDSMTAIEKREYKFLNGDAVCVRNTLCDLAFDSWRCETDYLDGMERTWKKAVLNVSDSPNMVFSEVVFDGAGRIARKYRNYTSKTSNPVYAAYSYDGLSRKTKAIFPPVTFNASPVTITYDYDYYNGQTTITQTKSCDTGRTTTKTVLEYFPNNESGSNEFVVPLPVASVDELGQTVTMVFDALHRTVSIMDPAGVCLLQEFDGISRLTRRKISNPGGMKPSSINDFSVSYDDNTGTKTITNQCTGAKIFFLQDRLYRLTKRKAPDEETTYTYDDVKAGAQGLLSAVMSSTGVSEAFSYDSRGCMQSSSLMIDNQTFTTFFEYTTGYALSRTTNPDKSILTNTFFENSNVVKQVQLQDSNSKTNVSSTFSHFDNGFFLPQVCDMGNGLTSTVNLAYNGVPLKAVLSKDSTTVLQQTWTLDSDSRLKSYNPSSSDVTNRIFEYNLGGQLKESQSSHTLASIEYKYDKSGNILSKGGMSFVNEGWQLTSITESSNEVISSFEYTPDGHLAQEKNGSGKLVRAMTYDSLGQMTAINSTKFVYDSRGRMVKADTGNSVTYYPTTNYEVTIKDNTTTQIAYLFHHNRRASISTDITSGTPSEPSVLYYHGDQLGSVIAVSDESGNILTTYSYDDYGVATVESGSDISRYKYSGKEAFDGLYYFGARFYDPVTGRFTTTDKIAISLQDITASILNQYTFSRNDPINFMDLNGNLSFWWHLFWHVCVDVAFVAAGVAAAIFLPEVPILSKALIGAGIGGLQYDGEAAFNALVYKQYHISDSSWGISLGIGAGFGFLEGAGAFKLVGKLAGKSGLKTLVGKAGAVFGRGSLVGKYSLMEEGENYIGKAILATVKSGAGTVAKAVGPSIVLDTGTSVAEKMIENASEHKDIFEGVGEAAVDGVVGGVIGGGLSKSIKTGIKEAIAHKALGDVDGLGFPSAKPEVVTKSVMRLNSSLIEGRSGFF